MCLSTRELVLRCCADLAEQQAKVVGSPEHKYGELTLSVGYLIEREVIEVAVVKGDNLSPTDKNGKDTNASHPLVSCILLLPSLSVLLFLVLHNIISSLFSGICLACVLPLLTVSTHGCHY